jgi:uncharacterized protein CbrC (UPF0167 family)
MYTDDWSALKNEATTTLQPFVVTQEIVPSYDKNGHATLYI